MLSANSGLAGTFLEQVRRSINGRIHPFLDSSRGALSSMRYKDAIDSGIQPHTYRVHLFSCFLL